MLIKRKSSLRILCTGSSGFIGRHLVSKCRHRWVDSTILTIDSANCLDCREFFAKDTKGVDIAFHCAAITGGIEGTTGNPAGLSAINAQLDGAFFEWALRTRPRRIVYFSSSCAYPMLTQDEMEYQYRLNENDINLHSFVGHPDNTYGWVKLTGEVIAQSVRDAGVPVSVVRPFAVYGTDQETCRMIPMFVQRALSNETVFEVWGSGTQASDFIHVDDVVNALLTIVDQDFDGPVNLGTGRGTTADEAAMMVMDEARISREIFHNLEKPTGPLWRVADPTLLETIYTPKITLEEGVARCLDAVK